ncbi:MAG: glutamine--fructose-6-phosphate transaminase (isomerizing) [Alphaproteobacteria bacterium]
MCGIIGVVSGKNVVPAIIDGLKRLEYRGYDSAGVAVLMDGHVERCRAVGKIVQLEAALKASPVEGTVGIGHTRWATHGVPNEANAHPHGNDKVAVVHNGIIENYLELKKDLQGKGYKFQSDTDTEVIVHLLTDFLKEGLFPQKAAAKTLAKLEGAFAIGIIFSGHPDFLICARRGSPLAIGHGADEMFIGSDALALAPFTSQITYLEEGDWAVIHQKNYQIFDHENNPVSRPIKQTALSGAMIGKGEYRHFMLKEIFEQPGVIGDILQAYVNPSAQEIHLDIALDFKKISTIYIVACGTAYYAGMVAKYWIEEYAHIPVQVDIASEFRYRHTPLPENSVAIFISQSGETADTLACLRHVKEQGHKTIGVINVPESSIAREVDFLAETHAGPEIGVASTKAFTAQLTVLACFALMAGRLRGILSKTAEKECLEGLMQLPRHMTEFLNHQDVIQKIAHFLQNSQTLIYLGRGSQFPIALEGALKLKEISYIHAEGFATGELKHGPIALIDEQTPVIVLIPKDRLLAKNVSNLEEVIARQGKIILFGDKEVIEQFKDKTSFSLALTELHPFVQPILYSLPMQLLAYYTAVFMGTDVDQPRNLAKSVTVE